MLNTSTGTCALLPATSFQLNILSRQTISRLPVCPLLGITRRHLVGANLHVLNSLCQHPYTQSGEAFFMSVRDVCPLKLCRAITESVGLATVTNTSRPLEGEEHSGNFSAYLKLMTGKKKKHNPVKSHKLTKKKEFNTRQEVCIWVSGLWTSQLVSSSISNVNARGASTELVTSPHGVQRGSHTCNPLFQRGIGSKHGICHITLVIKGRTWKLFGPETI